MTSAIELNHYMRFKESFAGVYARNKIPIYSSNFNGCLIVNTHTNNLPGQHWIGIVCKDMKMYYFDPLGWIPYTSIMQKFSKFKVQEFNVERVQEFGSTTCGLHVVYYLYHFIPAINDECAVSFINNILK